MMSWLQLACSSRMAKNALQVVVVVPFCVASYSAAKNEMNRSGDERPHGGEDRQ